MIIIYYKACNIVSLRSLLTFLYIYIILVIKKKKWKFHVQVYWNVFKGWEFGEMVMNSKMVDITHSKSIVI